MGTVDKWGYSSTEQDRRRKEIILSLTHMCSMLSDCVFDSALEIETKDAWVIKDIKAFNLFATTANTADMFPINVRTLKIGDIEFDDKTPADFDVVLSIDGLHTGGSTDKTVELINKTAQMFVLTSNQESLECSQAINKIKHRQILEASYQYNEVAQKLRVYMVEGSEKLWNIPTA